MSGALVLISGGLDSTVAAALHGDVRLGLFVDYGQRAAAREEQAAHAVGRSLGFPVLVATLPLLGQITSSALVCRDRELPHPDEDEMGPASADAVWVPNRNGVLVNLGAALAEARGFGEVVVGFNAEEAATFPDNGAGFVDALNACLRYGTRGRVKVVCPTLGMDKAGLLTAGKRAGAPIEATWSCYEGGLKPCGRCESCRRRQRAERALL